MLVFVTRSIPTKKATGLEILSHEIKNSCITASQFFLADLGGFERT